MCSKVLIPATTLLKGEKAEGDEQLDAMRPEHE